MTSKFDFPIVNLDEMKGSKQTKRYIHCAKCMDERPDNVSPKEYGNYEIGFTEMGIEVWCKRHDELVTYINLYDIWNVINTFKEIQGKEKMPYIPVKEEYRPDSLIHTGISGVYIDPEEYWKDGDMPEYLLRRLNSKLEDVA